jgi:hypothetical protein
MHPACVENRGCALTREKLEFDAHHPDQVVLSPTEAKADGFIDIIMGNRNGMMITQTEKDDAIEWVANPKQKIKSASRMFDWENHLDKDSMLQAAFEFVMEVAIENELSLEDITVAPKSIVSETDKALVVQMWAKCIDLHLDHDKLKRKTKPDLIQHAKQLMALYMNTKGSTRSATSATRKRGRSSDNANSNSCAYMYPNHSREIHKMSKRNQDPKSNLIAKSAELAASRKMDYSEVSVSEVSGSLVASFGKRVQKKNGVVLVDVEMTFAHDFPDVRVKILKANFTMGSSSKSSNGYLAYGLDASKDVIPLADCDFLPQPLGRASDRAFVYGHHWYPFKLQARLALMWYCLYAHSDEQWRMKWLLFPMGEGNNEVEVCQKKFDDNDSTFALNLEDIVVLHINAIAYNDNQ